MKYVYFCAIVQILLLFNITLSTFWSVDELFFDGEHLNENGHTAVFICLYWSDLWIFAYYTQFVLFSMSLNIGTLSMVIIPNSTHSRIKQNQKNCHWNLDRLLLCKSIFALLRKLRQSEKFSYILLLQQQKFSNAQGFVVFVHRFWEYESVNFLCDVA